MMVYMFFGFLGVLLVVDFMVDYCIKSFFEEIERLMLDYWIFDV